MEADDRPPADALDAYLVEAELADPDLAKRQERVRAAAEAMRRHREPRWLGPLLLMISVALIAAFVTWRIR